ncbi:hypothetical protein AMATHDRAFT_140548 [Amanita thiersii Skay4041]|uniref:Glycosyltransferase family 64 protein n=1 Tax=Amanita thiersii Skay4041 TaxID=703135 RepID=A0A2A9NMM5_9AGAR|nr:hypothetical protein AMATHDRAFT_140548 [Amanita thiersii Skay4041]
MFHHLASFLAIPFAIIAIIIWKEPRYIFDTFWWSVEDDVPSRTHLPNVPSHADTTAIILNWSRLPNVLKIVATLCQPQSENTISQIFIWNNSPHKINHTTFAETGCPSEVLRIHNSPTNLYFQARFLACEQVSTPFCFIQDDDYLVRPETVRAMRSHITEQSTSSIHLLPPFEMLSSQFRTMDVGSDLHTSFAWLGYGTLIPRKMAKDFLSLLQQLNVSDEITKMADNYFTVLRNSIPEMWFDNGVELGGGQPFTVGVEGDERNKHHIATQMLNLLISQRYSLQGKDVPFINFQYTRSPSISRAPCMGRLCIFETSIPLLPLDVPSLAPHAEEMLSLEATRMQTFGRDRIEHYINHPPSHAVDGQNETCFKSPEHAKEGDWISLDLVQLRSDPISVYMIVDKSTEAILSQSCLFEIFTDDWASIQASFACSDWDIGLRLCSLVIQHPRQYENRWGKFRARLRESVEKGWQICEIWARDMGRVGLLTSQV